MKNRDLSIIIVDDLQFSRIVVKTALKKAGYDGVRMADSATQALDMLNQQPADVVLADWMMPEMDGYEAIRQIRSSSSGIQNIPIITLTAKAMKGDRQKCLDAGANDYLAKPVDTEKLLSLLRVWLY